MEALTINNLAPYLPFGLKFHHVDALFMPQGQISKMTCLSEDCICFDQGADYYFDDFEDNDNPEIKPICFSLDNLTKPITINGETFVPIERLFYCLRISGKGIPVEPVELPTLVGALKQEVVRGSYNIPNSNDSTIKSNENL